jgi:hypothetical protein
MLSSLTVVVVVTGVGAGAGFFRWHAASVTAASVKRTADRDEATDRTRLAIARISVSAARA